VGDFRALGPLPLAALGQGCGKAAVGNALQLVGCRQFQVFFARSVTGLTADINLGEGGAEGLIGGAVILDQIGAVALGAAAVPVLVLAGPVQGILVVDRLVGIEVVPALPALGGGTGVPGDAQCLQAPPGERQQVLLQGVDAEHIFHRVIRELAVLPVRTHLELIALAKKTRGHPVVAESRVVKIPQNGLRCGQLHGQVVMRALPVVELGFMAAFAGLAAGECVATAAQQQQAQNQESGKHWAAAVQ
jgi:hypothetical protein